MFFLYLVGISFVAFNTPTFADSLEPISPFDDRFRKYDGRETLVKALEEMGSELDAPAGYVMSNSVSHCIMPLPSNVPGLDAMYRHTFLMTQDKKTYGMPMAIGDKWGGRAVISSPDRFAANPTNLQRSKCRPAYRPQDVSEERFGARFSCIASKLSFAPPQEKTVILDYSWYNHNCQSAVRFLLGCAGGEISFNPNRGMGSVFNPDHKAMVYTHREPDKNYNLAAIKKFDERNSQVITYKQACEMARRECF